MIHKIRTSKFSKVIASYLAIQLILTTVQPTNLFALTGGPAQPEFNSFTPIGTSDMVNLSSGDFNYNIPIMDVGGYPLNLAYNSGITMDQEASWVGLGWNLNVGQIARQVRGIPDDFKGDEIRYENDLRDNITVGTNFNIQPAFFGNDVPINIGLGLGVQYNNYEGISFKPSYGISYAISENVNLGLNFSSSTAEGATINPSISISKKGDLRKDFTVSTASGNLGIGINSRKGLENMSLSVSGKNDQISFIKLFTGIGPDTFDVGKGSFGGSISFNDQSYTPRKRAGLKNGNFSFSAGIGAEVFGGEVDGRITGYGSFQKIRNSEKNKLVKAYGYENTEANEGGNGILDFNREKDRTFTKNTTVLPITNYTYDIYAIQGQGILGQFRPFRGQTSYVYDQKVTDYGAGGSFGLEFGVGNLVHTGFDIKVSPSTSSSGKWVDKNYARAKFVEEVNDTNPLEYEPVYFTTIGELGVDVEPEIYENQLYTNQAIKIGLGGNKYNRKSLPEFVVKSNNTDGTASYTSETIPSKIKRSKRLRRNQSIQKITHKEAQFESQIEYRSDAFVKNHHTVGIKVLKPDGSKYVFGKTAYNIKKVEATFDMSGSNAINCATGIIGNMGANGNTSSSSDKFVNRITTPGYAHTYLLSSVLSSDYEDVDNNGPTLNDLGTYTKFDYTKPESNFKWRIPYSGTEASFNEGLKSKTNDQKGNYIYGEKELVYIKKIETKTHVAIFQLSNREDGRGAKGETTNSGTAGYQQKIDKIYLFSRPEFEPYRAQYENDSNADDPTHEELAKHSIKIAHFEYNYSLCQGVPNNLNNGGKLTLDKVYFTYRGSNMGKYTPYIFNYEKDFDGNGTIDNNPSYNLKGYDVWGNYKYNNSNAGCGANDPITTAEFPYTDQDKITADDDARSWTLTSIDLPSGGKLDFETEADDYQYVQNRKVMQMFNITGAGNSASDVSKLNSPILYNGGNHISHIYAKISEETNLNLSTQDFIDDYIGDQIGKPIMFRALLNMTNNSWQKDYVSGYFELDNGSDFQIHTISSGVNAGTYAAIPIKSLKKEGGFINSNADVNPISKAGWYFGRTYLNREVYSLGGDSNNTNFASIVSDLVSSLGSVFEIFSGPNGRLQEKGSARTFNPEKSWVRLLNPTKRKLGGGLRVTKIQMHDNWDLMTDNNVDNPLYKQFYGQEYSYNNEDGNTSGVATFEPSSSKENPLIEPFYDNSTTSRDKLTAPKESNYTEKPLGESFFPSPTVTYGRVEVKNLQRGEDTDNLKVRKHATGKVINSFYTSFDFPTLTDYTDIAPTYADNSSPLSGLLNISVKNHLTFSQGFVIETNDMNGKMKNIRVFAEGQNTSISGVDYNYNVTDNGTLYNNLPTINSDGTVNNNNLLGVHYDVVNDFRENYSKSETFGVNTNLAAFLAAIFPIIVVVPVPQYAVHENILRTTTTTKVIHKTGILTEKIAYDLGSQISTQNLAWDAVTGNVILTKTINEYDDFYYNFNYPSYWHYSGMFQASKNLGIEGVLSHPNQTKSYFRIQGETNLRDVFTEGDELLISPTSGISSTKRYWVNGFNTLGNGIQLIDIDGDILDECGEAGINYDFKISRSGYRNQQVASMASVTTVLNPIDIDNDGIFNDITESSFVYNNAETNNPLIVNSSAVEYKEYWRPQQESNLTSYPSDIFLDSNGNAVFPQYTGVNPYINNIKGDWRAVKSYAYLTSRDNSITNVSPRKDGYFDSFSPFYNLNSAGSWEKQPLNWTSASEVTKYSPYGSELENKDALDRYSSAQYGYSYTLPMAVASNSEYREIGFDGFEDYEFADDGSSSINPHFSFIDVVNQSSNASITDVTSHTGRNSIAINNGGNVVLTKSLSECNTPIRDDIDCSEPPPPDCPCGGTYPNCIPCPCPDDVSLSVGLSSGNGDILAYPYVDVFGFSGITITNVVKVGSGTCTSFLEPISTSNTNQVFRIQMTCNTSILNDEVYQVFIDVPTGGDGISCDDNFIYVTIENFQ